MSKFLKNRFNYLLTELWEIYTSVHIDIKQRWVQSLCAKSKPAFASWEDGLYPEWVLLAEMKEEREVF